MDGWVDGWMDGWLDGWLDGGIDGWMEEGWMIEKTSFVTLLAFYKALQSRLERRVTR